MSLSNMLASISAAGHCCANDTTVHSCAKDTAEYLRELQNVVNSKQFQIEGIADIAPYKDELGSLFSGFGLPILWTIGVSIAIIAFLWCVFRLFSSRWRDILLRATFIISLLLGFIVYDIGTCTGEKFSLFTNAPMAFLHALGMFILDSDVSAIHEPFHNSWVYMAFFSLAHTLAAVASTLFIIKHFGFHIAASLKMLWASSCFGRKKDDTYVFWGLNEPTFRLIKSIREHYGKNKNYRIIVVRSNKHGDDSAESRSKFSRIFSFLALRNAELEKLQALKCLSASTNADSTQINLDELAQKRPRWLRRLFTFKYRVLGGILGYGPDGISVWPFNIIGRELCLRSVRRILARKTRKKIHMLFLSEDDSENLHDVALLLGDNTIKDFAKKTYKAKAKATDGSADSKVEFVEKSREVFFHCHARYNSVHRVIEDLNSSENITVNVIDSSHINVEMLKKKEEILPVQFVKVEKDATVSSKFRALVVGFSEVGLDSARFLYEFGAFVKYEETATQEPPVAVKRSDFHLDVIDSNMPDLAGPFVANAPAVEPSMPFLENGKREGALVTLHKMDCCSAEFYIALKDRIKELNYIVIATGDDELNISTGVRIFKMAARYRDDMENLCILVRAHNDDDGHIRKIALHYNRLWAAHKAATVQKIPKRELNQTMFRREQPAELPIYIFGLDKDVYTYKNIIDDALENDAINFKEIYEASTNQDYKPAEEKEKKAWVIEYKTLMQLCVVKDKVDKNKEYDLRPYYPTYGGLMKLRRTQGQDFANSLHRKTKEQLAQKALLLLRSNNDIKVFKDFCRKSNQTTYKYTATDKDENEINGLTRILDVLAQTEHLRWNASHEIFGHRHTEECGEGCDTRQMPVTNDVCGKKCDKECKYNLGYKDEDRQIHNCIRPWENLDTITKSYDYNIVDVTLDIITPQNPLRPSDKP